MKSRNGRIRCPILLCAFNVAGEEASSRRNFEYCVINLFDEFQQPSIPYFAKSVDYRKIQDVCSTLGSHIEDIDQDTLVKFGKLIRNHVLPREITDYLRCLEDEYYLQIFLVTNDIYIPWEILHDDTGFWSLKYAIGRIYGVSHGDPMRFRSLGRARKADRPPLLLISDPEGNLEYAKAEGATLLRRLKHDFNVTSLCGKTSATDLAMSIGSDEYDIVHFAGHANMQHGGALRAYRGELEGRDIAGYSLSRRPVVFGNACSTGAKKYYGANSRNLAEAFIEAGASAFIGTLWQTTDKLSTQFAAGLYEHLRDGRTIGDSLRLAKVEMVRKARRMDIDWAAFALFGDPSSRLFLTASQKNTVVRHVQIVMSNKPGTLGRVLVALSGFGVNIIQGRSITYDNRRAAGYVAEVEVSAKMDEAKLIADLRKGPIKGLLREIEFC